MIIDVFILIFSIAILIITYRMSTLYYIFKEIEDGGCKVGPKSPVMKIFIPISVHLGSIINSLIGIKESYRVNLLLIGADVDDIMKTSHFVAFR